MATRPAVVIVGGGIGGLFAAHALIARGPQVTVYEQASALGEIGAGVFVTPNAVRQLERVGLGPAVERWGARVGTGSHYFRHDGTPIAPVQVADADGWHAFFGMHRADFVDLLAAGLPEGIVRTGHRAVGVEQDGDMARVTFANGARPKPMSSSPPTASIRSCSRTSFRRRSRSSTARSPTAGWCRATGCPAGRWIAG